ncbi:hypothetical protein QTP88_010080 [Uroleucon formosanum]
MENTCAMNDNNISEKEFLLQFISIYRDMPMLWRIKSKEYMDKHKRINAIKKLTELLKRENNKVKKSMVSGSGTDEVYVPLLWYYKELEFLQDQMEEESGISSIIEQMVNRR